MVPHNFVSSQFSVEKKNKCKRVKEFTRKTASRAAKTVMSAQETVLPHSLWTRALISSMVFKASVLIPAFAGWSLSPGFPSNNKDPSHPYICISMSD